MHKIKGKRLSMQCIGGLFFDTFSVKSKFNSINGIEIRKIREPEKFGVKKDGISGRIQRNNIENRKKKQNMDK